MCLPFQTLQRSEIKLHAAYKFWAQVLVTGLVNLRLSQKFFYPKFKIAASDNLELGRNFHSFICLNAARVQILVFAHPLDFMDQIKYEKVWTLDLCTLVIWMRINVQSVCCMYCIYGKFFLNFSFIWFCLMLSNDFDLENKNVLKTFKIFKSR